MAQFRELGPAEAVGEPDHVLIVKHDEGRFEVTGTSGAGKPDTQFLTPPPLEDKDAAIACAEAFATLNALSVIYIKGFRVSAPVA